MHPYKSYGLTGWLALCSLALVNGYGQSLPATLPVDQSTAASDGKVKVYLLAGQSNMVGFGYLQDSPPVYPSLYLSADKKIKVGRMPVGPSGLLRHRIYQQDESDSPAGAKVLVYAREFDPDFDYSGLEPIKIESVGLGNVSEKLPKVDPSHTVVVEAFVEVPLSGTFEFHPGFEGSSYAVAWLDGKEVYRKQVGEEPQLNPARMTAGRRYPIKIIYRHGGSAAFWLKQVEMKGKGDLRTLMDSGKFSWFADANRDWVVRNDVTYWETRISQKEFGEGGPLSATSNGKFIGPEVPFGFVMGAYHEEPVLLIESSMGNRSLSFDFRPPSSGKTEEEKSNEFCGAEYDLLVKGVRKTLANLDKVVPGYQGQGYEIAGLVWFQGHKDKGIPREVYEEHLVNLIKDLRDEFDAPSMKVVVATVGFGGMDMEAGHYMTWEAQMAVGNPKKYPEFEGNVASVDTRPFWRSRGVSPTNTGYHYNHNAETYVLTGDEAGRAMVRLMGGAADSIVVEETEALDADVERVFSDEVTGNFNKRGPHYAPDYYRQMGQSLKPMIMDEVIPGFLASAFASSSRGVIRPLVTRQIPTSKPADLRSDLDTLIDYYDIAGLSDYRWKDFAPGMRNATWNYLTFDPSEKQEVEKSDRYRKVTLPRGSERWKEADFDPSKATGWQVGLAPFGSMDGQLKPLRPRCNGRFCGCSEEPKTLWDKEVLLMQQTFEIPDLKPGHVYRLILGGAGCDRTGEGFAIYVNGKLLKQSNGGFFRYTGIRGAYLFDDAFPDFQGGEVTIAIMSFLRYTHFRNGTTYFGPNSDYYAKPVPPNGHVNLWMQEAKLSKETLKASEVTE